MIQLIQPPDQGGTISQPDEWASDEVWQAIADADVLQPVQKAGQQRIARLSPREQQVLKGIAAGHSNKMVAHQLQISSKTVEKHRGNVMKKMRVTSVPDLMRLWFQAYPHDLRLRPQIRTEQPSSPR